MVNKSTLCSVGIDLRSDRQGHKLLSNDKSAFNVHFGDTWHAYAAENQQCYASALLSKKSRG